MEALAKIIRGIASIPVVGGYFVLLVGFLPIVGLIPLGLSTGMLLLLGGVLIALWCFFLSAKNIINIVTPIIPIPNWVLGVVMAIAGVYGMVTNAWDDDHTDSELVRKEVVSSKSVASPVEAEPKLEAEMQLKSKAVEENAIHLQQESQTEFDKIKDEAYEKALVDMQSALADLEELSESIGQEKLDELLGEQVSSENSLNFKEAMAEMRKQIAELKSQGYGAGNAE